MSRTTEKAIMTTYELAEIDGWQTLPFESFAVQAIRDLISRFLGIAAHADILRGSFFQQNMDQERILRPMKIVSVTIVESLKRIQIELHSQQRIIRDNEEQSKFLKMLVNDIMPVVDNFDYFIRQLPQNENKNVVISVWNIRDNNLVRLRHLLRICTAYAENLL